MLSFQPGKASRRPDNGRCVLKARSLTAPSVFAFPCLVRPEQPAGGHPPVCRRGRGRQSRQSGQCPLGLGGAQGGSVLNLVGRVGRCPHCTVHPHPTHCCRSADCAVQVLTHPGGLPGSSGHRLHPRMKACPSAFWVLM